MAAIDPSAIWSHEAHILARISDALEASNFLFIRANWDESSGHAPPEPPDPMWRPGIAEIEPEPAAMASGTELAQWFGEMNAL
ncbi:hypothetical protein ACFU99_00730 [Streptomyces sp. NPDC057654]|uniref:hypothetical protein n=1 Tax=Streptomyces sp. NPDC057654 TaxID=3346196 RepID=UPI0036A7300A